MALFTDGPISNILDLSARDSQLLSVASTENIDVTQKMLLAQDEIGLELVTMLDRLSYVDQAFWLAPQPGLNNVVVTPALKLWHVLRSLELVYADAFNNQLNDRYGGKRNQFHDLAKWAGEKLIQIGVGICTCPVAQPAIPTLVTALPAVGGRPLPDNTYYVTTAWVNTHGEEGASAVPNAISTSGATIGVDPGPVPPNAVAWNVFIGIAPDMMTLQNGNQIPAGQTWLQPGVLATSARMPGTGQSPAYIKPVPRMLQRG